MIGNVLHVDRLGLVIATIWFLVPVDEWTRNSVGFTRYFSNNDQRSVAYPVTVVAMMAEATIAQASVCASVRKVTE